MRLGLPVSGRLSQPLIKRRSPLFLFLYVFVSFLGSSGFGEPDRCALVSAISDLDPLTHLNAHSRPPLMEKYGVEVGGNAGVLDL